MKRPGRIIPVSISAISSGAETAVRTVKGRIQPLISRAMEGTRFDTWSHFLRKTGAHFCGKCSRASIMGQPADIGDPPEDGRGRDHRGTHDVRQRAAALTALEV